MTVVSYKHRGFSLVELAVVLALLAVVGLFAARWITAVREPETRIDMQRMLNEAQVAVEGFLLTHHRLPCSAGSTAGTETCSDPSAVFLPWRTLGLSSVFGQLHYGVNRGGGADLATLPAASVSPDLNISFSGVPVLPPAPSLYQARVNSTTVSGAVTAAATATAAARARLQVAMDSVTARRTVVNGLDWCQVLRRFAADTSVAGALAAGNTGVNVPVAYIIVHPGENRQFDGNNAVGASATWRFDFPGRAQDHLFDDMAVAFGPADLGARLGCTAQLSDMQAAAQGAFAAYDTTRVMQEFWAMRVFDLATSESGVKSAEANVALGAMGLALATTSAVLAVASAANTEAITVLGIAAAAVNVGIAIAQVALFAKDLDEANAALQTSKDKMAAADVYASQTFDALANALNKATLLDTKGLTP